MTTAEARPTPPTLDFKKARSKIADYEIRDGAHNLRFCEELQRQHEEAIAAVRAEERERIVKALREQGVIYGEDTTGEQYWNDAATFVESLDRGEG